MVAVDYNFMRGYVDGFVLAVPKKKIRAYKRLAEKAARVWRKHGALDYVPRLSATTSAQNGLESSSPEQ